MSAGAVTTLHQGTTSACAENTLRPTANINRSGNYLRVRGEYNIFRKEESWQLELPPRARRILSAGAVTTLHQGTTSACAENTASMARKRSSKRNYLRVRGEYWCRSRLLRRGWELPPRARRIRVSHRAR